MKRYSITVNGSIYDVVVEEADAVSAPAATAEAPKATASAATGNIKIEAPMPGTIVSVKISAGEKVQKGAVIAVFEAMKMENDIVAGEDGVIVAVNVKQGDSVNTGTIIATMNGV
jgi:biotin carboxyl carrier protein